MNILKSLFGDRSIASSIGANLLTKVVLTISQLILIPIYLKYWGNIIYGDWLIITTIPNYLMISDFGLNATASNEFCRLIAQQKHQEAFKLFRAVNSCFLVFGICLLCLFYTTISIANLKELLSINELSEIDTRLIIFFIV
ncbi:hypothetical protein BWI92_11320 [Flectobacillus sp. BAB-3569]|nr:hypothetical protein BWI92_11320 [Flectobacillus sp. BAB-3569]